MFLGVYWNQSVCPSMFLSVYKIYFLTKCWRGCQVTFSDSSNSDFSKFKAEADNKLNVAQTLEFVLEREENILGREENAGYHHFIFFKTCFQRLSFTRSLSGLCGEELKQGRPVKTHTVKFYSFFAAP